MIFSFFVFGATQVYALTSDSDLNNNFPSGCSSNSGFSETTGLACSSGKNLISFWYGKVNQHTNPSVIDNGAWMTDPDGVSGANLDILTYCKKWYPKTTKVVPFKNQTIMNWKDRGNVSNYKSTKMAYSCVEELSSENPSITVLSPNGGETYFDEQQIEVKWETYNIPSDYKINVSLAGYNSDGDLMMYTLLAQSSNDGSEVVNLHKIPTYTGMSFGKYYKIALIDFNGTGYSDYSDDKFTINKDGISPTDSKITLISPEPGSRITAGDKIKIKWESHNLPIRNGNQLKMIIKRGDSKIGEIRIEDDGGETTTIPLNTPNGEYQIEYGTISPSSDGGDNYVKYGSANFMVVTPTTPIIKLDPIVTPGNSINCKDGEIYNSITGKKCLNLVEIKKACNSAAGCLNSTQISRTLRVGVKGEDVKILQTFLGLDSDGIYGKITAEKVKEWQISKNLKSDGIVGPKTRELLK